MSNYEFSLTSSSVKSKCLSNNPTVNNTLLKFNNSPVVGRRTSVCSVPLK